MRFAMKAVSGPQKGRALFCLGLLVLAALLSGGCGHVISEGLRRQADPKLTLAMVQQDPEAHRGRVVIWGGEIVEAANEEDDRTSIEVYQRPLGFSEEPDSTLPSEGRFFILAEMVLDTYPLKQGRKITVAGNVAGERAKRIGETEFRYPLVRSRELHLWPEYYCPRDYPPFNYYFGGPFGPWPPYPYWYPYGLYRCYPW